MSNSPLFTVFTPTFNRAHLLHRVHDSLQAQTFRDFEWVIVDDGSTDHTASLVSDWERQAPFPIRYFQQSHGHKKKAFNRGVREAHGTLFLPWDSDDAAVPEALETFHRQWVAIPVSARANFVGVCGLCMDECGVVVGTQFPEAIFDSNTLESRHKYKVTGDKWGFSRTDILRQYPFPEIVDGHVPEGVVWSAISRKYTTRYINKKLLIRHISQDSLTNSGKEISGKLSNVEGQLLWYKSILEYDLRWIKYDLAWFIRVAANYSRFYFHARNTPPSFDRRLTGWRSRLLRVMTWPVGLALYLHDKCD